jgi:glutamate formiminotransferase/glutamate formiminotransferase/formiminotetrahydrofolate cyclodeaminase
VGETHQVLECVVNISEGRDTSTIAAIAEAAGSALLDLHTDPDHNRSVLTLVGTDAPRAVAAAAVDRLDLSTHAGVHPRIGVVDVVPFVALDGSDPADALAARDAFARWAGHELGVPCFHYGPERTLPEVRRGAFSTLTPDTGPAGPHPSAGAMAVGARPVLVAYNVWLAEADLSRARRIASELRSPAVRALGLQVGDHVQVSCNLVDPATVGPGAVTDLVKAQVKVGRCELVGLVPRWVLDGEDPARWDELDLGPERTIEARAAARPDLGG